ncbi:hypothetical protein RchiOBHm_Chr2g0112841 [Rosa chinensis]|uniref:DUF4220 domain-containing protein n=1 Tax=Rosa chinensis TaxID=74649 RepID=A0A2P6RQA5_ROSCH|nr:uncharacterized protein LOC112185361 isoform X1 [Rosa chinensis]PRQ48625.1 hypothetical protein RchiOBHm_Chr2g0112841 [Rosa chinensis]
MASLAAPISNKVKKIWDDWNLRSFIILSLSLQTFLILFAPLRKRTSSKWLIVPIWLAYLLADWSANFAIGLIASSQTNTDQGSPENGNLLAFWAPFLLLHLGGPDTIIAIAMEDNALWPRHLLGLIFQVVAAAYVFGMQFSNQNKLLWPTLLLFVPALVKYGERTRALYLASLESLKETILAVPEPGPDYAKYMDEYSSRKAAHLPIKIEIEEGRSSDSKNVTYRLGEGDVIDNITLVEGAHHLFQISMGLIIDLVFDYHQRKESRAYFIKLESGDAFTSIATELNFMYEALYTKAYVVHSKRGYLLRATSFIAVCIAFVFFYRIEKHGFHSFDVGITYSLLFGAIALDSVALSMLILSDWTIAIVYKFCKKSRAVTDLMKKYLEFKRSWGPTTTPKCLERTRKILFRRWCESISGFSFIDYSLRECGRSVRLRPGDRFGLVYLYHRFIRFLGHRYLQIIRFFGLKYLRDEMKYRSSKRLEEILWKFIFEELESKSEVVDDPKIGREICSSQGDWVLLKKYEKHPEYKNLLACFVDVTYDRRVLLWHIATEICYYSVDTGTGGDNRKYSKTLSDYMLYLLIMQPALMSSVAGIGQKRFRDTVAEANKFFKKRGLGSDVKLGEGKLREACCKLLDVDTGVKPVDVKGNRSKSVLFDACILARQLMKFEDKKKWELISSVWVELLSYAASHCRAHSHAQLLTKGGELVTFVWLLMARFGIEEDIQVLEVQARVKLIMNKQPDDFKNNWRTD